MTFDELNLNTPILNALSENGFVHPTSIQEQIYSVVMSGKDVVGVAQTGTGKTFAYLLPLLRQFKFSDQKQPRILIVVPTRELVLQVVGEIEKLTKYMTVRFAGVYGGTNINNQKILVHNGLDILVATPGRLLDLCLSGVLRLKSVNKLVIDEVDEMLNLGFRSQLTSIMDLLPPKRQNILFSATLTEEIDKLIENFFNQPQKIEVAASGTPVDKIIQTAYHVPNFYTKVNLLEHLLSDETMIKVLVFVESKSLADRMYEQLTSKFPRQLGVIHSNKSQNFRINSLKLFEEGVHRVLIATDLISRGLDLKNISHVINFDTPEIPEDYIHRIGRTGRADKEGVAITFINETEEAYQAEIEKLMNKKIPIQTLPESVVISDVFSDDEKPATSKKDYLKDVVVKISEGGAFHEKSEKNSKVNLGGSYKRMIKIKYTKPKRRNNNKKR